MLTLFHHGTSVCASKVRITLAEKDLYWDGVLLDLQNGDQKKPDYLAINPNGVVPTLVHDGSVIIESTVINEYLEEAFGGVQLRPQDPVGRARMRSWTRREDSIHDAINVLTSALYFRHQDLSIPFGRGPRRADRISDVVKKARWLDILENGIDAKDVPIASQRILSQLRLMENQLHKSKWLAGDSYTLADIGLISFFHRMEMLHTPFWTTGFPLVSDWYWRARERKSFSKGIQVFIAPETFEAYDTICAADGFRLLESSIALA